MANPKIEVDFRARVTKFLQDAERVQGKMKGIGKSAQLMAKTLAGVAAFAGFTKLVGSSLAAADAISKSAKAAGISTTAFQELNHVAGLAGVEQSTFANGVGTFNKRLGELRSNTGPMVSFLKKYDEGMIATLQSTSSSEEALNLFLNKMASIKDPSEAAALAAAGFSKTVGIQMVEMTRNGTNALADTRQEAHDLGKVLSQDLLEGAEDANDAMSKMTTALKSLFQGIVIQLAPAITASAEWLTATIPAGFKTAQDAIFNFLIFFGDIPTEIKKKIDETLLHFKHMKEDAIKFVEQMIEGIKTAFTQKFTAIVDFVGEKVESVTGFFSDMYEKVVGNSFVPDMVTEIGQWFEELGPKMVDPAEEMTGKVSGFFSDMAASVSDAIKSVLTGAASLKDGLNGIMGSIKGIVVGRVESVIGGAIDKGVNAVLSSVGKKVFGAFTTTGAGGGVVAGATAGGAAGSLGSSLHGGAQFGSSGAGALAIPAILAAYGFNRVGQNDKAQGVSAMRISGDQLGGGFGGSGFDFLGQNMTRQARGDMEGYITLTKEANDTTKQLQAIIESTGAEIDLTYTKGGKTVVQFGADTQQAFDEAKGALAQYSPEVKKFFDDELKMVEESLRGTMRREDIELQLAGTRKQNAADWIASMKMSEAEVTALANTIVTQFGTAEADVQVLIKAMGDGIVTAAELAAAGIQGMTEGTIKDLQKLTAAANSTSGALKNIGGGEGQGNNSLPGFATGGSFMVGGSPGTDSNVVAFKATKGERVTVETPGQQNNNGGSVMNKKLDKMISLLAENNRLRQAGNNQLKSAVRV